MSGIIKCATNIEFASAYYLCSKKDRYGNK